ncbi:hypothetical protein FCN77_11875 [Arthrobacter sp. 24S4-2]|uniref:hypothetical protein n=1 Tax=Arthrobacter sp. 24S4-2 TaxID=2575374 RepID=UPI0010C7E171|nr:hypothetical protein [Arthrobacter sp. 24S4-2]QCO98265.1 hypothetical protein FCN77_11875 [Arthrobacter sp. 24S4-2]
MNPSRRPEPHNSSVPGRADIPDDFIAVDDTADFSYYRSEQDLLAGFESVGEARSIVDRHGTNYCLALDANRRIVLGPSLGPVEFRWLRHAWESARSVKSRNHRLLRFHPGTRNQLLLDLFEILALERVIDPFPGPWILEMDGPPERLQSLHEVDDRLAGAAQLEHVRVRDPFRRTYRPVRRRKRRFSRLAQDPVVYVEVHPAR